VNVLSSNVRVMQIFTGVREIWGVKQESGRLRCRFSYLSLAIFSESSSPRLKLATHSIFAKLWHKHDKLTQCCRAFTLALARLSCYHLLLLRLLFITSCYSHSSLMALSSLWCADVPLSSCSSSAIPASHCLLYLMVHFKVSSTTQQQMFKLWWKWCIVIKV